MHINNGFHTYSMAFLARGLRVLHTCLNILLLKVKSATVEALIPSMGHVVDEPTLASILV